MADFTKSEGEILGWALLDDTTTDDPFAETGIQAKATEMIVDVIITVAHADVIDAASSFVTVRTLARAGADNEAWRNIVGFQAGGGQAVTEALDANSGVSEVNPERIYVAATTDWDTGEGEWLFLRDNGNLLNSTLALIRGWADADYYICAWDLVRDYDNADALFDGVDQIPVRIPPGVEFFNITFHNSHATATYAVRVDYAEVDDIV